MVVLAIPCAKDAAHANESLKPWKDKGYKLAIFRDIGMEPIDADLQIFGEYKGYPRAANMMCRAALAAWPEVNFCVTAGDDMFPAEPPVEFIESECIEHFGSTDGVMQPTGDKLGWDGSTYAAERICGSPWIGRKFVEMLKGKPFNEDYKHFFADQQMFEEWVATPWLWQRPDLAHFHNHWSRENGPPKMDYQDRATENWAHDEAVFMKWRAKKR